MANEISTTQNPKEVQAFHCLRLSAAHRRVSAGAGTSSTSRFAASLAPQQTRFSAEYRYFQSMLWPLALQTPNIFETENFTTL